MPRRHVPTPLSGSVISPAVGTSTWDRSSASFRPSAASEPWQPHLGRDSNGADSSPTVSPGTHRPGARQQEYPHMTAVAVAANTRFPALRAVLWDCSPQGAPVELRPARLLPEVQLSAAVVDALIYAQPGQYFLLGKEVARRDRPGRREGRSPLFVAEALAAGRSTPEDVEVCVVEGDDGGFYVPAETLSLEPGGIGALVEAAHDALCHPGPLGALGRFRVRILAAGNRRTNSLAVAAHCVYVPAACSLTPILPCRVLPTQLSVAVGQVGAARETGFITIDDARRVVLLAEAGSLWADHALVGVWAAGVDGPEDPLVWGACLRFAYSRAIPDRATQRGGFLVVLYLADAIMPAFFHCRPREPDMAFTHLSLARNVGASSKDLALRFKDAVPDPRGAEEATHIDIPRSYIPTDTNDGSCASSPLRTPSGTPASGSPPRSLRGGGTSSKGTNSLANSVSGGFGHTVGQTTAGLPLQAQFEGGDLSAHAVAQNRRHAGSSSSRGSNHIYHEAPSALQSAAQVGDNDGAHGGVVIVERSAYEAQQRLVHELTSRVDELQQQIRAVLESGNKLADGPTAAKPYSPIRTEAGDRYLRQDSIASSSEDPFVMHIGATPLSRGGAWRAGLVGSGVIPSTTPLHGSATPLTHGSVLSPLGGGDSLGAFEGRYDPVILSSSPKVSPPRPGQVIAHSPSRGSHTQDSHHSSSAIDIPRIIDPDPPTGEGGFYSGSPSTGVRDRGTEALFLKYLGIGSDPQ